MVDGRTSRASDPDALSAAFEAHYVGLMRMATLVTGDPFVAEDLVQEAFVRAAAPISRLPIAEIRPYLRATVLNLWRNRLRRLSLERLASVRPSSRADVPLEERDALWQAILRLPPRQRACLVLRYYEELTETEAARVLHARSGPSRARRVGHLTGCVRNCAMNLEDRVKASLRRRAAIEVPDEPQAWARISQRRGSTRPSALNRGVVVAVALGISVATVALVIEAFANDPQRSLVPPRMVGFPRS